MITATTSGQPLEPDDHRATAERALKHPKDVRHGKNQRRLARIKHHRPHPRPTAPRKTAVIQASNPRQAAALDNTESIKSP